MKRDKTCRQVLLEHINSTENWYKKAELYLVAEDWLAETVGRALRLLEEEGLIQKGLYDGRYAKGLVKYSRLNTPQQTKPRVEIVEVDGQPEARIILGIFDALSEIK